MLLINLKPNKYEQYDGIRDHLTVNTWLYSVKYLSLIHLLSPNLPLTDGKWIIFPFSYYKRHAAVWWYNKAVSSDTPITWDNLELGLISDYIPDNHVQRARDKILILKDTTSILKYSGNYRTNVFVISIINESEKIGRFVGGSKHWLNVELATKNCDSFEEYLGPRAAY